jgi:hypothetical protein
MRCISRFDAQQTVWKCHEDFLWFIERTLSWARYRHVSQYLPRERCLATISSTADQFPKKPDKSAAYLWRPCIEKRMSWSPNGRNPPI